MNQYPSQKLLTANISAQAVDIDERILEELLWKHDVIHVCHFLFVDGDHPMNLLKDLNALLSTLLLSAFNVTTSLLA